MNWYLSYDRYEEIRTAVADTIEDWNIELYPFSVWDLVRRMGIRTVRYSELPISLRDEIKLYWPDAITIYPPNYDPVKTIIFYNDKQSREHIRFTIAHELAHPILMHPGTDEDIYEHTADIFANYLLAPAPLVQRYSQLDADSISRDFQVSHSCACSVRDRTRKRYEFGSNECTEYEYRILSFCSMRDGDALCNSD